MIKNISKNKIVVKDYVKCHDFISKFFGLMFRKNITPLVFIFNKEKIVSLHSFFVKFPIDIVFLNELFEVVELKKNMMPYQFYTPKNKALFVLELPEHSIVNSSIELNDIVSFK